MMNIVNEAGCLDKNKLYEALTESPKVKEIRAPKMFDKIISVAKEIPDLKAAWDIVDYSSTGLTTDSIIKGKRFEIATTIAAGCEGAYLDVYANIIEKAGEYSIHVATIKTLMETSVCQRDDNGKFVWTYIGPKGYTFLGQIAGAISYLSEVYISVNEDMFLED